MGGRKYELVPWTVKTAGSRTRQKIMQGGRMLHAILSGILNISQIDNIKQTKKGILLNNGVEMPILGFGVYQIPDAAECERCVLDAIEAGYRSIDTAQAYYNEEAVGRAAAACGVPREELFIATKVWMTNGGYDKAKASIDESLRKLRMDYADLILVHQPFNDYYGSYRAMEEAYRAGKARAIGVSNFHLDRFVYLAEFCEVTPAVNQMETHVFNQQVKTQEIMSGYGTRLESWGPFAEGRNGFFSNEVLKAIGEKYGKTVAQTAIRFLIQRNIAAIPKSTHRERMEENINVFDFELSQQDMEDIKGLDRGESLFLSHTDPETVRFLINYGK